MRKLVLVTLALVTLALLLYFALRTEPAAAPGSPTPAAAAAPREEPVARVDAPVVVEEEAPAAREIVEAPTEPVSVASDSGPNFTARGRVVDESGAPIVGARVRMYSVGGPWAEGRKVSTETVGGRTLEAFAATSSADGSFELAGPVPTSDWVTLWVEATPFHGQNDRHFGPAGGRNQARLAEGANELGDLVLARTGGARGRVLGADGRPIEKARVSLDGHFPGGRVANAVTDVDGRYELGHLPVGGWTISATAEGWLTSKTENVECALERWTENVDFRLDRSPSIAGIVVDERGAPLPKIRVWGWPTSSGQGAGGTTADDGRFVIHLPQNEPYYLEVTRAKGFEPWGGMRKSANQFPPGTTDVRIVLKRLDVVLFRVVDAVTQAPVTHYALAFEDVPENGHSWNRFDMLPSPKERANGETEAPARPGKQEVGIVAAGYAPLQTLVAPETPADGAGAGTLVQTLRLERGGVITGTLELGGAPPASASLRLEADRIKLDPTKPDSDDPWFDPNLGRDLGELAGRKQMITPRADGTFLVEDLAAGTYQLTIDGVGAARRVVRGVKLAAGETKALGKLELLPEARITGRVIAPAGSSPVGLELRLEESGAFDFGREESIEGADGTFAFEGLAAGKYTVTLQAGAPFVPADVQREVELAASGAAEVVFDLAGSAPCDVLVTVRRGTQPAPGLHVRWRYETGEEGGRRSERPLTTDAEGVARGKFAGGTRGRFVVLAPSGFELARSPEERVLPAAASYEERITVSAGELVLEFPKDYVLPERGSLNVTLQSVEEGERRWTNVQVATANAPFPGLSTLRWTSPRVELGLIAAGKWELGVHVLELKMVDGGTERWESKDLGGFAGRTIEVHVGETTVVTIP